MAAEPKSGKLFKLSAGLFGARWSEKWAHWDGRVLKCFPLASAPQSSFSWAGSRPNGCVFDLTDYSFALADEKKLNRKHVFHLVPSDRVARPGIFACVSGQDLAEWRGALTQGASVASPEREASSIVAEKVRRVAEVFSSVRQSSSVVMTEFLSPNEAYMTTAQLDLRRTDKLETSKLRVLLREISFPTPLLSSLYIDPPSNFASFPYISAAADCLEHAGWQGEDTELALIQQQLDPTQQGKVSRDRLLRWLTNYYNAQHVMERVQNEKTTQAKREGAACVDPTLLSRAIGDEPVLGNQLHAHNAEPEHSSRSLSSDNGGFDWNAQYYNLQSDTSTADPFVRGLRVAGLMSRFRQAAERVVRSIVEELSLSDEAKSVRPQLCTDRPEFLATDGLPASVWHNGSLTVYHHDGMLIYVASVQGRGPIPDDPPSGMSGAIDATQTQLELARIWKHQIKAAQALRCAIEETQRDGQRDDGAGQARSSRAYRLCVPLQCMVDYLGCQCFVVASKAMQNESTRSSSSLNSLSGVKEAIKGDLQSAFDRLGLLSEASISSSEQEHSEASGNFTLPIFFPSNAGYSVEIDEEVPVIMLHNLASLFPPVVLDGDFTNSQTNLGRLRHEFVQQHGSYIPLSSNALLSVPASLDVGESRSPQYVGLLQLSLQSACEHLVEVVIPSFMADFEAMPLKLVHPQELTKALHASGVNVRFLGRCYTLATQPDTKRFIMAEMLARAAKVELDISLRAIVDECCFGSNQMSLSSASNNADNPDLTLPQPNEIAGDRHAIVRESTTRAAIEFLNLMFGTAGHPDARAFWENRLLPRARDKFSLHGDYPSLAFEAIMSGESVYFPQLFHAVQMHTNIVFCDHMEYDFRSPLPVSKLDLSSSEPKSRVSANTTAECEEILAATDELIACGQLDTALDNVKFQLAILHADEEGGNCQSMTLSNYLSCAAELSLRLGRLADAREYAVLAIEVAPRNHAVAARAHTIAMKLDGLSGDVDGAERHFVEATSAAKWHLGPSSGVLTDIFMTMVDVCATTGDLERAERVLDDCSKLIRQSLGRWSLPYADVCRRQAMLMYTRWQSTSAPSPEEAGIVLHDAITIYERHLSAPTSTTDGAQIKLLVASCYYLAAEVSCGADVLDSGATQNAFTMALKALKLRKEALPSSHGDVLASNLQLGMLAGRIGEPFRAMEYYRNALAILKQGTTEGTSLEFPSDDESTHSVDRIRDVSRAMLQLFLGALSSEQQDTVDKTKWHFAALIDSLREEKRLDDPENFESDALPMVVRNLFLQDPVEYATWLIDGTEHEMLAAPHSHLPGMRERQSSGPAPNEHLGKPSTQTLGGDISFGAQLAVVLFLTEAGEDTTV